MTFHPAERPGVIVKLIDGSGNTVVEYSYDSWGKPLSYTGTLATTLGVLNPFRYRGYVYDEETQWYYLKSRYYDPETCRFISADVLLSTGQGVLGHNCYAYCRNNPVGKLDENGLQEMDATRPWGGSDRAGGYAPANIESSGCAPSIRHKIKIYWYEYGEEKQAIEAFEMGYTVYYGSARLSLIRNTKTFQASFTILNTIHLHPLQVDEETLRHEYGHILQERKLGEWKYIRRIAIPSVIYNVVSRSISELVDNY